MGTDVDLRRCLHNRGEVEREEVEVGFRSPGLWIPILASTNSPHIARRPGQNECVGLECHGLKQCSTARGTKGASEAKDTNSLPHW
eukprot:5571805-Pyramimonas_sp.AAC.1